jgi:hypothetical protein
LRETEAEWSDEEMLWRQAEEEAELVVEEKLKQESPNTPPPPYPLPTPRPPYP